MTTKLYRVTVPQHPVYFGQWRYVVPGRVIEAGGETAADAIRRVAALAHDMAEIPRLRYLLDQSVAVSTAVEVEKPRHKSKK